jgi:hydrogenase-4 component B
MSWDLLLLYAAPGVPLFFTVLAVFPVFRSRLLSFLPFAPLPALAAALLLPEGLTDPFPRTLLGAGVGLEPTSRIFLGVAALLWTLAGIYARATIRGERSGRFAGFWLATLSGNLFLFLALDLISFYLAFASLSLAAFGLVVHYGTPEARRASRIYLVMAMFGETLLLLGFLVAAHETGSIMIADVRSALAEAPQRNLALGLLIAGFGLKAGLMPLHMWLPLAHPAAPVPASAVLSGAIVKAGIFGLVSFLPLDAALSGWSAVLVMMGLATAYLGVFFGIVQQRPKTVLAYSTLSQMGLLIVVLGSALASSGAGFAIAAVTLYSAHHSLAKGALFLSVGVMEKSGRSSRGAIMLAAGIAALAIAGLPLTGGALAKLAIKAPLGQGLSALLVTASAAGTTLLMLRFLQLLRRTPAVEGRPSTGVLVPFLTCIFAAFTVPWLLFPDIAEQTVGYALQPANLWGALWPVLAGAVIMAGALRLPRLPALRVPEGDLIIPFERWFRLILLGMRKLDRLRLPQWRPLPAPRLVASLDHIERQLARWSAAGPLLLAVSGIIFGLWLLQSR